MMVDSDTDGTADATRRLNVKKQTLDDAYAVPANFLEIDVLNPVTTELPGKKRYTEYEVNMRVSTYTGHCDYNESRDRLIIHIPCSQTNLPVFKVKESRVMRRYSDFEWLRNELERDSKVGELILLNLN